MGSRIKTTEAWKGDSSSFLKKQKKRKTCSRRSHTPPGFGGKHAHIDTRKSQFSVTQTHKLVNDSCVQTLNSVFFSVASRRQNQHHHIYILIEVIYHIRFILKAVNKKSSCCSLFPFLIDRKGKVRRSYLESLIKSLTLRGRRNEISFQVC